MLKKINRSKTLAVIFIDTVDLSGNSKFDGMMIIG